MASTARTALAGLLVLGAALTAPAAAPSWPAEGTAEDKAAARVNGPAISSVFNLEAGPPVTRDDVVGLAAAPAAADQAAFGFAALKKAQSLPVARSDVPWQQVGRGEGLEEDPERGALTSGRLNATGITLSLADDPRDTTGSTIYVGSGGGLWKTTNAGRTFTQLDLPAVPVGGLAVDPSDPDTVIAATGQAFQGGGEGGGLGVFVSRDAGRTWTRPSANVGGNGGQQVSFTPDGSAVFVATDRGLWRSTDRGASFVNVQLPTNAAGTAPAAGTPVGSWTSDVKVRPGAPNEIYAAVGYVAGNVQIEGGIDAAPGNGLYLSTTGGAPGSFTRVDVSSPVTGWTQNPKGSDDPIGRTRLAFTPDGKHLYALVADAGLRGGRSVGDQAIPLGLGSDTSLNGLYLTDLTLPTSVWTLEGTSESLAVAPGGSQVILSGASLLGFQPGIQAWYNGWIAVDPLNPARVFLGEEETYVSISDPRLPGTSGFKVIDRYFSPCSPDCPPETPIYGGLSTHPDQHEGLPIRSGSTTRLWSGNDGGTFYQDAHATTDQTGFDNGGWKSVATYNTLLPYRAVKGSDGSVIAGLQDNGTVKWEQGNPTALAICGGDGTGVATAPENPNTFYCQENGSLSVTTDGGKTTSGTGSPAAPAFQPAAFLMDPLDERHLMIADSSVYETLKGSASTSEDWIETFTTPNGETIEAVDAYGANAYAAFCGACSSSVIAGIDALDRGLATNVDDGCESVAGTNKCWHLAKLKGMPDREIFALAIDPENRRTVYLATVAPSVVKVDFGDPARIVMSTDAGHTVRDISGDLPRGNVYDVKVDGENVYAAHDLGVFTAVKGTTSWKRLGPNLPVGRVYGLSFSADRTELVASTYGSGVWTQKLARKAVLPTGPRGGDSGGPGGRIPATGGLPLAGLGLVLLVMALGVRAARGRSVRPSAG
jgi:hypothetical protein